MIDESVPHEWFHRAGFKRARKLLLILWLVLGNFLLMGYSGTLLTSLVKIRYEDAIDTLYDLEKSGLPFLLPGGIGLENDLGKIQISVMERIMDLQSEFFPFNGTAPQSIYDR